MKTEPYFKSFTSEERAVNWWRMMKSTARARQVYCLVDGPDDDFVVVDLKTAIEIGNGYRF